MRFLTVILILFFSCQEQRADESPPLTKTATEISYDQILNRNYDVPELKNYKDKSKYIAVFTINKRYNNHIFIEYSEAENGAHLCVKQPFVYPKNHTYNPLRSLPFNQLCYWYAKQDSERIKELFQQYDSGRIESDIGCQGCLDPEIWTLEIYNHGKYSSITKDAYGKYEPFIDSLFKKVFLNKENNFSISY